jgi:hypothetical protein
MFHATISEHTKLLGEKMQKNIFTRLVITREEGRRKR